MTSGILDRILLELQQIRWRLDDIERRQTQQVTPQALSMSNADFDLLKLPDHLRQTYMTVNRLGECDSNLVSLNTGRCRAVECHYLNDLVKLGWLHRHRQGRIVKFCIIKGRLTIAASQI